MHLVSLARQKVRVCGKSIEFRRGETIHTENSYKYTVELFRSHASGAGWTNARPCGCRRTISRSTRCAPRAL